METETRLDESQAPPLASLPETPHPAAPVRGRPFVKGQSGNPKGRPSRARVAAIVTDGLIARKAVPLTQRMIELALAGDRTALRFCLERIAPTRRDAPVPFELPPIANTRDLRNAMMAVADAAASGAITAAQAASLMRMLQTAFPYA